MDLSKNILITGASSGIGEVSALCLAKKGYRVFAGVRKPEDGERLLNQGGARIVPVTIDVTDYDSINKAKAFIENETSGTLHALVNNAGVAYCGAAETLPMRQVQQLFDVNVLGVFAITQAFLPMLRQACGRIVNMGSISGLFAVPGLSAYSASKHALEGFSDAIRVELAPFGISVSIIEPGKIDTPIWEKELNVQAQKSSSNANAVELIYEPLNIFYQNYASTEKATPINRVVSALEHALDSPAPKPRYVIGSPAKLRTLLNRIPTRWRDRLVLKNVPITRP